MVKQKPFEVLWSNRSLNQLKEIFNYIENESPEGARKVVNAIAKRVGSLKNRAMIYEADRYKKSNDGSYRATTVYKYRIVYQIKTSQVLILKILHTARLPKNY